MSIVPEATTRQQMLEGGEVDIATARCPWITSPRSKSDSNYTVYKEPSFF
ncbi:MAG: hypothetical protein U0X93_00750 [Anaerolineales bacterium]